VIEEDALIWPAVAMGSLCTSHQMNKTGQVRVADGRGMSSAAVFGTMSLVIKSIHVSKDNNSNWGF
jgi:hypothetical protein